MRTFQDQVEDGDGDHDREKKSVSARGKGGIRLSSGCEEAEYGDGDDRDGC